MKNQRLQLCILGAVLFKLNIELDGNFLEDEIKEFEKQRVTVGVLDKSKNAAISKNKGDGLKNFQGGKAMKIKKRDKAFPMYQLADFLDYNYGFISNAAENPNNKDLVVVMNELKKIFDGNVNPRRIENGAIALVRNQILRKDFGSNKESTKDNKGFDMPLVRTGALFNSIKASYTP